MIKFKKTVEQMKLLRWSFNNSKHFKWYYTASIIFVLTSTRLLIYERSEELMNYLKGFCEPEKALSPVVVQMIDKANEADNSTPYSRDLIDGDYLTIRYNGEDYLFDKKLIPNMFKKKNITYSLFIMNKVHMIAIYENGYLSAIVLGCVREVMYV